MSVTPLKTPISLSASHTASPAQSPISQLYDMLHQKADLKLAMAPEFAYDEMFTLALIASSCKQKLSDLLQSKQLLFLKTGEQAPEGYFGLGYKDKFSIGERGSNFANLLHLLGMNSMHFFHERADFIKFLQAQGGDHMPREFADGCTSSYIPHLRYSGWTEVRLCGLAEGIFSGTKIRKVNKEPAVDCMSKAADYFHRLMCAALETRLAEPIDPKIKNTAATRFEHLTYHLPAAEKLALLPLSVHMNLLLRGRFAGRQSAISAGLLAVDIYDLRLAGWSEPVLRSFGEDLLDCLFQRAAV